MAYEFTFASFGNPRTEPIFMRASVYKWRSSWHIPSGASQYIHTSDGSIHSHICDDSVCWIACVVCVCVRVVQTRIMADDDAAKQMSDRARFTGIH